ncbi:MAG: phosphoribosylanthranilate isomerase [Methylotenera sp.]|uniref:N-(5'-phosphoribosyl)anthranilate isomerase n=1 Tax=Methylotenera mobilis TaxID=359408 RepID=A0A351RCV0_9PROT|nr:phosphoribosylanthranilate isomerase [Methylotenera mobilis]PPC97991.1 MAG: phosphoribosylanthranilate isomerase [Methylotenera sp.]PPD46921.1 MAG: phosphoribosylanthranilate isomerase [Methylotenera sp.]HBA09871.1 phosphoribosylanthranilate isomerase [Methylotenera mobilis]
MRVRVKICGITRVEDALVAVENGADAIGLVFYEPSPRAVSVEQAIKIVSQIPAFISIVGLFVNAEERFVRDVISNVALDLLQFHGDEAPEECSSYGLPFMKAIRVKSDTNLVQCAKDYSASRALLLDTYTEGVAGGTGHTFDWGLIPSDLNKPVVLAGGLTAENVGSAIQQVKPYAVDVSGGVELSKGIKDAAKIAAFMQQVYL